MKVFCLSFLQKKIYLCKVHRSYSGLKTISDLIVTQVCKILFYLKMRCQWSIQVIHSRKYWFRYRFFTLKDNLLSWHISRNGLFKHNISSHEFRTSFYFFLMQDIVFSNNTYMPLIILNGKYVLMMLVTILFTNTEIIKQFNSD